jgi:regulator of protease activity HflC (stomatin/prohibitin superfamily)
MEVLLVFIAIVVFMIAAMGLKIVRPWQKGLVERLGKYQRTVGSGLTLILPFLENL